MGKNENSSTEEGISPKHLANQLPLETSLES